MFLKFSVNSNTYTIESSSKGDILRFFFKYSYDGMIIPIYESENNYCSDMKVIVAWASALGISASAVKPRW